jgi:DivIVA domain-containing protein
MTWFFAFLVVAVVGAVVVAATGPGGGMAPVYDDRPDARIPADGPLTASDLREVRFTTAFRGYRMSEVDALLDRLAADAPEAGSGAAAPGAPASGAPTSDLNAPDQGADPAERPRRSPGTPGTPGERAQ